MYLFTMYSIGLISILDIVSVNVAAGFDHITLSSMNRYNHLKKKVTVFS